MIRAQQRKAYQLLQEAGWRIVDDKMVDATGKPVVIEFLLAQTEFERVLLPFKRNLERPGYRSGDPPRRRFAVHQPRALAGLRHDRRQLPAVQLAG